MKNIVLIQLLGILIFSSAFSQDSLCILEIRDNYKKWQPIIEKELKDCEKYYNYVWGENYQDDKWCKNSIDNDTLILSEIFSIIQIDDMGTFVYSNKYSFSGDWYITVDYYYDINGKLYFIYWRMNTFYAEKPVTVEKRLYFDKPGDNIRKLQSVYKMNTKEKTNITFMDRDVEYKLDLIEMDFYQFWEND